MGAGIMDRATAQDRPMPKGAGRTGIKRGLIGLAVLLGLVAVACTPGSYPLDIFYEMHYQQSYKSHEPPRLLGVEGAVAFYPGPVNTTDNSGAHLYEVNCSMCHGADAKGTGPVLNVLMTTYNYSPIVPPDITTRPVSVVNSTLSRTSRPLGPTSVMPPFGKLLSPEERAAIADYIDTLPK